jgi:hypothetical protein
VGETEEGRTERQRRLFEGEWREALHQDGRLFFYHTATAERRWDLPPGGLDVLYPRRRYSLLQHLAGKGIPTGVPSIDEQAAKVRAAALTEGAGTPQQQQQKQ